MKGKMNTFKSDCELPQHIYKMLKEPASYVWQGGAPSTWANHIVEGLGDEFGLLRNLLVLDLQLAPQHRQQVAFSGR